MWRVATILALALGIGIGSAFAQEGQKKKEGLAKKRPNIEEVFKTKDKDHDGKLTLAEFVGNAKDPERLKEIEARFKAIDTKNNGYVTLDDFKAHWAKHEPGPGKHPGKRPPHKEKAATVT